MQMDSYSDPEPLYAPRRRVRPVRPELATSDQIVYASWRGPANEQSNQFPGDASGFERQTIALPSSNIGFEQEVIQAAPLAEGFVATVNERFGGDLSEALDDPDLRAWAEAIGLVHEGNLIYRDLSEQRIGIIRQIFADESLDPAAKIRAAAAILHG